AGVVAKLANLDNKASKWQVPPSSGLKLNRDAAVRTTHQKMGTDFVILDHDGTVIAAGLNCYTGEFTVENVELMALIDGLQFARLHGFRLVEVECDAFKVIQG
ncbi:Ribonuclease H-like domain containing protein, partial [Trema orientale]